jgi:hypothetical protein
MFRVYSIGSYGSNEVYNSNSLDEAKEFVNDQITEGADKDYVIYNEVGIVVYESPDDV